ncbi:MAG: hypothetical protein DHS20C19_23160 [Acidimicrobiales bacterium]|nr:MAG: hypothetical protein DHS20C19_23160 [Acidimicrobiales bacterium]
MAEDGEPFEAVSLPSEDTTLEIRPDSFVVTSGFLRAGDQSNVPPIAEAGPPWTFDEANEQAHGFLVHVAGERTMPEYLDDPVEHARANGLMLLFSEEVHDSFQTYLARMPDPRADAWRDLIAGGASSEAFGPLTLQEKLTEEQVGEALAVGRRQRIVNLIVGTVVTTVLVVGGIALYQAFLVDEGRTEGSFQFEDDSEPPAVAALTGGPPAAAPELTTALTVTVAVEAGSGPESDRVTVAPFSAYPHPPGSIRASLFQYAGSGHVVIVGPDGFTEDSCLRASVVTDLLRPLDTVTFGPCGQPVGRIPTVGCLGPSAVLLDLDVPTGGVDLPEGGTGFADAVRIQLVGDDPDYEVLTIRGTIEVAEDDAVAVPRFGGDEGDELTFDLGADRIGTCTLTGDLPGGS